MAFDAILEAREKRLEQIKSFNQGTISIKANIPGNNKNLQIAYILIKIFKVEVEKKINVKEHYFFNSADGPYYLLVVEKDEKIKDILIEIETTHQLGRYIDLDLFINDIRSISRINKRKCILCDNEAFYCIRKQTHKTSEVLAKIKTDVRLYLQDLIYKYCKTAIYGELNLESKFGLVTPTSCGSHPDMNYQLMEKAIEVILPGFEKMFMIGFYGQDLNNIYHQGKKIGLDLENKMFSKTNNINCYKGLIFILGLSILSVGYCLANNLNYEDIYINIQVMTKDIFSEPKFQTFGEFAYEKLHFGGARAEAQSGLQTVKLSVEFLNQFQDLNDEALHMTLIKIINNCDDTVMLKRAQGLNQYYYYKNLVSQIKTYDLKKIQEVTNLFINDNISCGGAADILIAALFIYQLKKIFW